MTAPGTRAVIDALAAGGAVARFAGGCVRDAAIGRPVSDIDVATPDPPATVSRLLEAAGLRWLPTGIGHGTVTALAGDTAIEVTTLRRDVETDGRHATVAFTGDWAADAARRDLTMNALYCDPDGTLYDPVGGLDDLRAGRVRFVGDAVARIDEDALRLLRFFRIYANYGTPPADGPALAACRERAGALATLSNERVGAEMLKLLAATAPVETLALMIEAGVLAEVVPQIAGLDALAELCAAEVGDGDALRRLALLLRRGRGGAAAEVVERLRLSNAQADRLSDMVAPRVDVVAGLDRRAQRAQRRALYRTGAPLFTDLVYLAWADAAFHERRGAEAVAAPYRAMIEAARAWVAPTLPVDGTDVMALGLASGPEVGRLLAELETWWEAGDFQSGRDEMLARLKELTAAG